MSLLPILSKLLERNLLLQHLMETQRLANSQWDFQRARSTVTALLKATHNWFEMLERGKEVGAVFFDLSIRFSSSPCSSNMWSAHRVRRLSSERVPYSTYYPPMDLIPSMYIRNRRGPTTEFCGTPDSTGRALLFITIGCFLPER